MWGGNTCQHCARSGAPCILAAWMRRCGINSPSGLAMAACTTTTLLNFKFQAFDSDQVVHPQWLPRLLMAVTVLGAVHYEEQ